MNIVDQALMLAVESHSGQYRKHSKAPFALHPIEVCNLLRRWGINNEVTLAAALLHDTVEDTLVTLEDIQEQFGKAVADYVEWLTYPTEDERKKMQLFGFGKAQKHKRIWLKNIGLHAPKGVRLIKYADRICNTRDFINSDQNKYAVGYMSQCKELHHEVGAYKLNNFFDYDWAWVNRVFKVHRDYCQALAEKKKNKEQSTAIIKTDI